MKFTIVTPSFGMLPYLRLCAASVADQRMPGVEVEHIVQDGGSTDGTGEWLAAQTGLTGISEPDEGMYDAINRGIRRGGGEVYAWLNCDEQYLPGALDTVRRYFMDNPAVDIVVGHAIVVDSTGGYMCHRKAVMPRMPILRLGRLPVLSSSMFFRDRVVKGERGMLFDTWWKAMGDWHWVTSAVERGVRIGLIDAFLSTFTDTGANLGYSAQSKKETAHIRAKLTPAQKVAVPLVRAEEYLRKIRDGYYRQPPFDYAIYDADPAAATGVAGQRRTRHVAKPTFYWKGRAFVQ